MFVVRQQEHPDKNHVKTDTNYVKTLKKHVLSVLIDQPIYDEL